MLKIYQRNSTVINNINNFYDKLTKNIFFNEAKPKH